MAKKGKQAEQTKEKKSVPKVLKVKDEDGGKLVFVYTDGFLICRHNGSTIFITERASMKLVQFLINNWLKNG